MRLADRAEHWAPACLLTAVALAFWPGLAGGSFSPPKFAIIGVAAIGWLASGFRSGAKNAPLLLPFATLASPALSLLAGDAGTLDGLLTTSAFGLLLLALILRPPAPDAVASAGRIAGTATALIALLQLVGLDPFRALSLAPDLESDRLRIYGALGNPDFVAAFLTGTLLLTLATPRSIVPALLQLGAIAATRSYASAPALLVGVLFLAAARRSGGKKTLAALVLAALTVFAAAALTRDRPLGEALAGRRYLHALSLPHLFEAPLLGHGPGSFRILQPVWETEALRPEDRRFAAAQDHLHDDYLEWALTLGVVGLAIRGLLLGRALTTLFRTAPLHGAALTALCVRALVDFPFHRPAELCLTALLLAVASRSRP